MHYTYDGTFDGLLTTLRRIWQVGRGEVLSIWPASGAQGGLFGATVHVVTDEITARAVWANLLRWLSEKARERLYYVFLAEQLDSEILIYRYLQQTLAQQGTDISEQYADDTVRRVHELSRWLGREKHRMEAFVRFEQTTAGLYHATIDPDVNVLPIIAGHFARRYADQHWLIFDRRRRYGIRFDGRRVQLVHPDAGRSGGVGRGALVPAALTEREPMYQHLWQTYYASATIAARRSPERHRRHLPKRYWKYLTEKRPLVAPSIAAPASISTAANESRPAPDRKLREHRARPGK
ncbi:MAG: TIGR03915 family putative DNA repair protein [Hymenobacteraceae bacterium]|nr:TIGR03915 family putative DNA repair protein [Hymenobacteraceae bacterium]